MLHKEHKEAMGGLWGELKKGVLQHGANTGKPGISWYDKAHGQEGRGS